MCPGEPFLPHPPSPDDIIFDDTADNHDNEGGTDEAKEDNAPANQVSATESETPPTTSNAPPTDDVADPSNQTSN